MTGAIMPREAYYAEISKLNNTDKRDYLKKDSPQNFEAARTMRERWDLENPSFFEKTKYPVCSMTPPWIADSNSVAERSLRLQLQVEPPRESTWRKDKLKTSDR